MRAKAASRNAGLIRMATAKMFSLGLPGAGLRVGAENLSGPLIIGHDAIGDLRQLVAGVRGRMEVQRDHLGPLRQVFLTLRRELVLGRSF